MKIYRKESNEFRDSLRKAMASLSVGDMVALDRTEHLLFKQTKPEEIFGGWSHKEFAGAEPNELNNCLRIYRTK